VIVPAEKYPNMQGKFAGIRCRVCRFDPRTGNLCSHCFKRLDLNFFGRGGWSIHYLALEQDGGPSEVRWKKGCWESRLGRNVDSE